MREKTGNAHNVDVEQFLEDIKVVVRDGQELLKVGVGEFKQRARAGVEKTDHYVREKPYQTIGIAFGLGVVAGLLAVSLFRNATETEEE
jgi:ElaB/YqjD/DUF883 family membrane-anchored ribosome-binding protein